MRDLEKKFSDVPKTLLYRAVRLNFINCKYRDSVDLSFDKIEANFNTLRGIDETLKNIKNYESEIEGVSIEFREQMQEVIQSFTESLEDDFAIPEALSVMFQFQKFINFNMRD
jgi:cysteinyl-tRNA synthetase